MDCRRPVYWIEPSCNEPCRSFFSPNYKGKDKYIQGRMFLNMTTKEYKAVGHKALPKDK